MSQWLTTSRAITALQLQRMLHISHRKSEDPHSTLQYRVPKMSDLHLMFCGLTTNKWPVHRHTSDGWWNPPQLVVYIPYSASALKSTKNLYQKNFYICNCTTQSYTFTLMSISCLIFLTFVNYIIRHCISETRNHMISYSRRLVIWNRFQGKQNSIFFVTFKWLKQF